MLAAFVVLTRLPLLSFGFGSDDDAYRNIVAALRTLETGSYAPSRVPGFPVLDLMLVTLLPLGAPAVLAATVVAQMVAVAMLYEIAIASRVSRPGLVGLLFASTPSFWITSTQAMDYAFGVAAYLSSYHLLLRGHTVRAGWLGGVAIGCRPSNIVGVLAAMLCMLSGRRIHQVVRYMAVAGATALVLFGPLLMLPEMRNLQAHAAQHIGTHHAVPGQLPGLFRGSMVFLFGKLGSAAIVIGVLWTCGRLARHAPKQTLRWRSARQPVVFESAAMAGWIMLFLLIPYEPAYLLPIIPLVYLLLGRVLGAAPLIVLTVAVASEAMVLPLLDVGRIVPGRIVLERIERRRQEFATKALLSLGGRGRQVFIVGEEALPRLVAASRLERRPPAWQAFGSKGVALWTKDRATGFAAGLTPRQEESLRQRGYQIVPVQPSP